MSTHKYIWRWFLRCCQAAPSRCVWSIPNSYGLEVCLLTWQLKKPNGRWIDSKVSLVIHFRHLKRGKTGAGGKITSYLSDLAGLAQGPKSHQRRKWRDSWWLPLVQHTRLVQCASLILLSSWGIVCNWLIAAHFFLEHKMFNGVAYVDLRGCRHR